MEDQALKALICKRMKPYWGGTEGWLKFMQDELKYKPDKVVIPVIDDVANYRDTALRSSHGVGKTTLASVLLLTCSAIVPEVLAYQISPTWGQVKGIFWNELRKWYGNSTYMRQVFEIAPKSPKMWCKISAQRWYAEGKASNAPGKIEGKHARRVFLVGDECKAIPDDIFQAVQGALTSKLVWRLFVSTPTTPAKGYSVFYRCFTKNRALFKCHKISAHESPRVSKGWIKSMEAEWGPESQVVMARVNAEFPTASGDILIPLQKAEAFYDQNVKPEGKIGIGVDVARFGDDESVISVWKGNTLIYCKVFEKNTINHLCDETINASMKFGGQCIAVDDTGLGGGLTDQLAQKINVKLTTVVPFVYAHKPRKPKKFSQKGDQVLWEFAKELNEGNVKSLVEDETLTYQLASYKIEYTQTGKIKVKYPSRKTDRTSNEKSPDRADATFIGWYASQILATGQDVESSMQRREEFKKTLGTELRTEFAGIRKKDF